MNPIRRFHLALILLPCLASANEPVLTDVQKGAILHDTWKETVEDALIKSKESKPLPQKEPSEKVLQPKKLISLRTKDLPLSEAIGLIAGDLGLNPVLTSKIQDKPITVNLRGVPAKDALHTILFPLGYGFTIQEKNLVVLDQQTRIFRVMLPPLSQRFEDVTSNESFVQNDSSESQTSHNNGGSNQKIRVGAKVLVKNSSEKMSFWNDIKQNIRALVSPEGRYSLNKAAGTVMVTDSPNVLEQIENYFNDLNARITQQIEVDVKVVEVSLTDENRLGIDWQMLAKNLKEINSLSLATDFASHHFTGGNVMTFTTQGKGPAAGVTESGVKFVMDALALQGKVDVVSQPKMVMLNNQVSVIQVGSTQSYVDQSSIETTQSGGTITALSTSQVQEGVTMRLMGNIVGDEIYLSVTPVVTTIDGIRTIKTGNTTIEAPQTTTKSMSTLVKLKQGLTVAIGGLITSNVQKSTSGIPVLSRLPFLGKLFSYSQNQHHRSELIIFITPKKA